MTDATGDEGKGGTGARRGLPRPPRCRRAAGGVPRLTVTDPHATSQTVSWKRRDSKDTAVGGCDSECP